MRRRLVLSYLFLVLAVLVVLEVPLGVLAASHDKATMAAQAEREATGLSILVAEDFEQHIASQVPTLASQYRLRTGGEVMVVQAPHRVLAAAGTDRDDDSAGLDGRMLARALHGEASSAFEVDEGRAVAVAAVPMSIEAQSRGAVLLDVPAGSAVATARETWLLLGVFGAGVMVVATVVAVALARSVSRPLAQLEEAVGRLGRGDLQARAADGSGPPEVRSLATQFNRMAARLTDLLEAQNRFVADASHQLRSPLTALRLRLENLEAGEQGRASQGLAAAGRELQRLSRLVDGLLVLTQSSSEHPGTAPVDVGRVIAERCDAWSALADERDVGLVQGALPDRPAVADLVPGDLDQILDNLLANALDACPPGARIVVRLATEGPGLANLHVTDSGPGMPSEDRERAFERFWQGASKPGPGAPATAKATGGLGLAIVKELAVRNNLEVQLLEAPGGGLDAVVRTVLVVEGPRSSRTGERSPGRRAAAGAPGPAGPGDA